jgi:hypothetical protein
MKACQLTRTKIPEKILWQVVVQLAYIILFDLLVSEIFSKKLLTKKSFQKSVYSPSLEFSTKSESDSKSKVVSSMDFPAKS